MAGKNFTLSKKEKELMEIFWDAGAPLARAEILERAAQRKCSWKPNSVHILVNSLLDKKAVQVAGFYLSSRKLGRTFEAAVSREDYAIMQVEIAADQAKAEGVGKPNQLMAALIDDASSPSELEQMMRILEAKRKEIEARNPARKKNG